MGEGIDGISNLTELDSDPRLRTVVAALRARGYSWLFLGNGTRDESGTVRYWFNGSMFGTPKLKKQPYGWFTIDELLAEKFAEGCR